MADKPEVRPTSPFILQTEEDFTILLEALDSYWREAATLAYVGEAAKAAMSASKDIGEDGDVDIKEFEKSINSKMNKPRMIDSATRLRDKIILMKAKVVLTKEYFRGSNVSRQIEDLLGDLC